MTGFPSSTFRIINVGTVLCLYKLPAGGDSEDPVLATRVAQGKDEELWRFDGRIINVAPEPFGTFGLRVLDVKTGALSLQCNGSDRLAKWEHNDGIISSTSGDGVLTCTGEGPWQVKVAPANATVVPPIRKAIALSAVADDAYRISGDLGAWLDGAHEYELRRLVEDLPRLTAPTADIMFLRSLDPAMQRKSLKRMLASEPPGPTLDQQWRLVTP